MTSDNLIFRAYYFPANVRHVVTVTGKRWVEERVELMMPLWDINGFLEWK